MAIVFKGPTKHGALQFFPGVSIAFEDEGAEAYFTAAKFADETTDEPVATYAKGSVVIDPMTVHADDGKLVQPDAAAAATAANTVLEG